MSIELRETLVLCVAGEHEFEEIYSIEFETEDGELVKEIVNWCLICGAITVDTYKDGKLFPGDVVELIQPEVLQMTQLFYS